MPIRPFKELPKNLVEWGRFFQSTSVVPDPDSVGEDELQDGSVRYEKIQNVTPSRLLGRASSPAGVVQEISANGGVEFSGTAIRRSELTGDVTAEAGSNTTTLRDGAARSVLGRSGATVGPMADIAASADDQFLVRRSGALGFGALVEADIPAAIARDSEVTSAISALNLASAIYTPTLSNTTNVSGSTAYPCQYLRVGSVVTVSGVVDVQPTSTSTLTELGISLPVASNLGASNDCCGVTSCISIQQAGGIAGDSTNDRALLIFLANDTANRSFYFTFTYRII